MLIPFPLVIICVTTEALVNLPANMNPPMTFFVYFLISVFSCTSFADNRPVVVLAPAAWHSPIHYAEYLEQLNVAGYSTVSQRLPSCDSPLPRDQSVAADAAFIGRNLLMPSINAGKRVVLVMHSYSGGPGAMAAKGLSVAERSAAGKPGGIIGLIFIAAFIAKEGQSLLSGSGGKFAPWVIEYVRIASLTILFVIANEGLILAGRSIGRIKRSRELLQRCSKTAQ